MKKEQLPPKRCHWCYKPIGNIEYACKECWDIQFAKPTWKGKKSQLNDNS